MHLGRNRPVADLERSFAWYGGLLGYQRDFDFKDGGKVVAYALKHPAGGTPLGTSESRFEITYSDKITDHLLVQPDLQYIDHPGGDPQAPGALVGMVRFTVGF